MDIVQVNHMFLDGGGREEHVYQISKYLSLMGHRVTIVTSDYTPTGKYEIKKKADRLNGVKIVTLKGYQAKIPPGRIVIPDLSEFLIDYKADIIHGHGMGEQPPEDAMLVAKIKNIPFVFTPHFAPYSIYEKLHADKIWKVIQEYQFKNMLGASSKVVAVSPDEKEDMIKSTKYKGSNFTVIPNAFERSVKKIDPDTMLETFKKYNIPEGRKYVVFMGSLTNPRKGAVEAIQAFRHASLKRSDLHLILIGVWDTRLQYIGKDRQTATLLEKLSKTNHVTVTGWISDEDKYAIMQGSHIFLSPTYYEAFGIALAESLYNKLPVIATDIGGCRYVVRDGVDGFLVSDVQDKQAWVKKILWMAEHPDDAKNMGKKGYERVNKMFSWEKTVNKLEELYKTLHTES